MERLGAADDGSDDEGSKSFKASAARMRLEGFLRMVARWVAFVLHTVVYRMGGDLSMQTTQLRTTDERQ